MSLIMIRFAMNQIQNQIIASTSETQSTVTVAAKLLQLRSSASLA